MRPVIGITCDIKENFYRLRQEYIQAVAHSGGAPIIVPPVIDNAAHFSDMIDGLLLSGGGDIHPEYYGENISVPEDRLDFVHKQRTDFELSLLKEMLRRKKPVLAICFGMQLVNVFFGGPLYQDIELQVGDALDHKKDHEIKIIGPINSTFNIQHSAFSVNSSHHQAIKKLGEGLDAFAVSEDGIIEGFYKKDCPFLFCVQWHPERSLEFGVRSQESLEEKKSLESEKHDRLSLWLFETFIKNAKGDRNKP